MPGDDRLDIVNNVKIIEKLKHDLLNHITHLYGAFISNDANPLERVEILADIIITTYLLAERVGTDNKSLDEHMMHRLQTFVLDEQLTTHQNIKQLLYHINERCSSKG